MQLAESALPIKQLIESFPAQGQGAFLFKFELGLGGKLFNQGWRRWFRRYEYGPSPALKSQ